MKFEPFSALSSRFAPPKPGTLGFKLQNQLTKANVWAYRQTGGKVGGRLDRAPVLLLHHRGRRTAQLRVTPLLYMRDGADLVIVASSGGNAKHPAWYHNLTANPETEVEVGRDRRSVTARTASADERAALWPRLVALYPAYATYEQRTDRTIPVVILVTRGQVS